MNEERELVIKQTASVAELSKEEYSGFYRTKDMYLTAFLVARGNNWTGLEEVERSVIAHGKVTKKNKLIYFLFADKPQIERLGIHFYNMNRTSLNVNASSFVQSIMHVRSIITNPPF
jgi:hypothetical protein